MNSRQFFWAMRRSDRKSIRQRSSNGFRGRQELDLTKQFVIVQAPAQLIDNLVGRNEVIRQTF
jgi:hypothetical protein